MYLELAVVLSYSFTQGYRAARQFVDDTRSFLMIQLLDAFLMTSSVVKHGQQCSVIRAPAYGPHSLAQFRTDQWQFCP